MIFSSFHRSVFNVIAILVAWELTLWACSPVQKESWDHFESFSQDSISTQASWEKKKNLNIFATYCCSKHITSKMLIYQEICIISRCQKMLQRNISNLLNDNSFPLQRLQWLDKKMLNFLCWKVTHAPSGHQKRQCFQLLLFILGRSVSQVSLGRTATN